MVTKHWFLKKFGEVSLKFTARESQMFMLIEDIYDNYQDVKAKEAERNAGRRR